MEKKRIVRLIHPVAGLLPFRMLIRLSKQNFFLPFWHAVNDHPPEHYNLLFDVPTVQSFRNSMDQLLKYFKPVSLHEFLKLSREKILPKTPVMHLSFDDGLRECSEIIAPILKQKGVPASFFVNPAFIGNTALFYRYKASLLANRLLEKNLPECTLSGITRLLMKEGIPFSHLAAGILSIPYPKQELLDRAAVILGMDFRDYLENTQPYMDQNQVRSLITNGFTVGSHSLDHPHFSAINTEEQLEQTLVSSERVAMEYQLDYMVFAFPFTDSMLPLAFWEELGKRASYPLPTFGTSGLKEDTAPNSFQRTSMEINGINALEISKSEYLYHLLKRPFGKNKLQRK